MGIPHRSIVVFVAALAAMAALAPAASAGRSAGGTCGRKCPADTTPPTVSVTSPASGATVAGTVTVAGVASDNTGVARVELAVDGGAAVPASGTTSWSGTVATGALANGSHTVAATAVDTAGYRATATVTLNVANPVADTTPPSVAVATPASGATASGTLAAGGSASDNVSVARVDVQVDAGAFQPAAGTTSWTATVDTTALADGAHTLTARATDTSGNAAAVTVPFSVANGSGGDVVLADPSATNGLQLLGRGRAAEWGSLSVVLYWEDFTSKHSAFVRDSATGASSYVPLPADNLAGWSDVAYTMTSATDLWVLGGGGPMAVRHYSLAGSPVPTTATLVSDQVFGDTDSRQGDLLRLASGALMAVWHQQGETGPQGLWLAYLGAGAAAWRVTGPLQFMITKASKQTAVQHPVDGSLWVFSSPDAYGAIGAVHLTEAAGDLRVDWTDPLYIDRAKYELDGPDPENPDLSSAPDPSTGTIALAYQSAHRQMFQTSPTVVTGSYPMVARIPASGPPAFTLLPVYVERVSSLGLVVRPGETWLGYRPIDQATMTYDGLAVSVLRGGAWEAPMSLGRFAQIWDRLSFGVSRPDYAARLSDGRLHLFPLA